MQHTREQYSLSLPLGAGLVHAFDLAAAHAVDERDRTRHPAFDLQLAAGGALRVQHPVELGERHDAGRLAVPVLALVGLVVVEAGRDHDRAHLDVHLRGPVVEVDPPASDGLDTGVAAGAGGPVDRRQVRDAVRVGPVDRPAPAQAVVELVGNLHRAGGDCRVDVDEVRVHAAWRHAQGGGEVTDVAGDPDHLRAGQDGDVRPGHYLGDEAPDERPGQVFGREYRVQLRRVAAQEGRLLDQRHAEALPGEVQRGTKPGDAAAEDEGTVDSGHADLLERLEQARLGDRCPDQAARLERRGERTVGVRPAGLLAHVRGLEQVGVHPGPDDRPAEGGLVELGGARGDDHPVQAEILDVVDDRLLPLVGAHEHDVARNRDAVQAGRLRGDPVHVDDVRDVAAAVADVDADPLRHAWRVERLEGLLRHHAPP